MILNAKCGSIFEFATVIVQALAMYGLRSARLLFDVLQAAYDAHMERSQMRLAPIESRSWRGISRGGAHADCYQPWR